MIAGWSSKSGYSLLGVRRVLAQTISYEVRLAFILLSFVDMSSREISVASTIIADDNRMVIIAVVIIISVIYLVFTDFLIGSQLMTETCRPANFYANNSDDVLCFEGYLILLMFQHDGMDSSKIKFVIRSLLLPCTYFPIRCSVNIKLFYAV
jgi:hypothetical protein